MSYSPTPTGVLGRGSWAASDCLMLPKKACSFLPSLVQHLRSKQEIKYPVFSINTFKIQSSCLPRNSGHRWKRRSFASFWTSHLCYAGSDVDQQLVGTVSCCIHSGNYGSDSQFMESWHPNAMFYSPLPSTGTMDIWGEYGGYRVNAFWLVFFP